MFGPLNYIKVKYFFHYQEIQYLIIFYFHFVRPFSVIQMEGDFKILLTIIKTDDYLFSIRS